MAIINRVEDSLELEYNTYNFSAAIYRFKEKINGVLIKKFEVVVIAHINDKLIERYFICSKFQESEKIYLCFIDLLEKLKG